MIRACLLILGGGFAAQHSRLLVSSDLCVLLLVAAVTLFFFGRVRLPACFLLGFGLFVMAAQITVNGRLDPRFVGDSILTRVRVVDFPKVSGGSVTMIVTPIADSRLPTRSHIRWFEATQIPLMGEIWELELRLRRPRGHQNPGGFDLEAWMFREAMHATGYVVNGKRNRLLGNAAPSRRDQFRAAFVRQALLESPTSESAAVLAAIGVGARHLIAREQWDRYAITGTSHLMAISGLHVGLAAAAATLIFAVLSGALRVPGNHLDRAIVAGAVAATVYAFVSGLAVPSRRAIAMLLIVAVSVVVRRRIDPGRVVALSALIVFVFDPVASMSPGFNFSFAAVIVLLLLALRLSRPDPGGHRLARVVNTIRQLIAMQWALLMGLLPLTVLTFNRVPIAAPAVNILVVPVFSFITVPATLAAMLLGDGLAVVRRGLLRLAATSIEGIDAVISGVAASEVVDITTAGIRGAALCMLALTVLWVVLPRQWPGRWVAVLAAIAVALYRPAAPGASCFDAHILDVGQGLATIIQTERRTAVFDTGASYRGGSSAAAQIVLPFLQYRGIDRVDWLIVSHADNDHAGGVRSLLENLDVGLIVAGEPLPLPLSDEVQMCSAGRGWSVDGVEFNVLHPAPEDPRHGNDSSCVVKVSAGRYGLLLTGDIEAPAERQLVERGSLTPADVVVIPHHGSVTSSTPAFINLVQPDIAIASAGYRNRWGFPKSRITRRWEGAGARILTTAQSGAVSFRLCANGGISRLREHRAERFRFWRDGPGG